MHEKGIVDNLIKKILSLAEQHKATRIVKVYVTLGALSHMSSSHFKEHFDFSAQGTLAEGADIEAQASEDMKDPNAPYILLTSVDFQ